MGLDELRWRIDALDDEIVKLICARLRVCADIASYKAENGLPVHDPEREGRKQADVLVKADEDLRGYVGAVYSRIFEQSREFQKAWQRTMHDTRHQKTIVSAAPLCDASPQVGARFGVLGARLGHSYSPLIHALLADYEYRIFEKGPEELEGFLLEGDFDGLNVTIPYKEAVLPYCTSISSEAARIGAVNTLIRLAGGGLYGDNTDYYGFSYMLGRLGVSVKGRKALILGDGGAAAAVRAVLSDRGAGEIVNITRRGADNYGDIDRHFDAGVIINATPVGMYPGNGASLVDLGGFRSCEAVLDLVYNPLKTELILQAEDEGIPCEGGLRMLVAQAKRASEIFIGCRGAGGVAEPRKGGVPDSAPGHIDPCASNESIALIERVVGTARRKVKNIALIGMPGCGKTSVGRRLAEITGREFFDTDELVALEAGKGVERIIAEDGEDAFRGMEEAALMDAAKMSGCVIATGGGIVKREANRRLLRQNSVVVFIDRAPDELPADGRPLSQLHGAGRSYGERLPLYLEWSEHKITARSDVGRTAAAVKEVLGV